MRIFLSYASEDRQIAEEIALALEGEGHDVFFDRTDLESGADYNAVIRKRVADADLFLFLITPASIDEGSYTLTELRMAREKWAHPKERVIPIMLEPTALDRVPAYLRAVTILDPEGNVVAEVAAHVSSWWRRKRMRIIAAAVLAGGLAGSSVLHLIG
ncbi:MAG: toll/interleukin-1 receptor domain-containing protein, partial [Longimicrobiales bacterium]